jgi:hypothetical protein
MKSVLKNKVIGVAVELAEQESDDLNYWFSHRTDPPDGSPSDESDHTKYVRGEQVMIQLCKMLREGFHKDGD